MNKIHPKKLMLSKWTAVNVVGKDKHFLISNVIKPENLDQPIEFVELEALFSKKTMRILWRELRDEQLWRQGWL